MLRRRHAIACVSLIAALQPITSWGQTLPMPDLAAANAQPAAGEGGKYFYFHRDKVDYATALADIRQCDAFARGLNPETGSPLFGGLALALIADAANAANRRNLRRINLRRCMFFKGYGRYGVAKPVWQSFNFPDGEGDSTANEQRAAMLEMQARIAAGPKPATVELGE